MRAEEAGSPQGQRPLRGAAFRSPPGRALLAAYPLLLVAALTFVHLPWDTRLAGAFQNAGHVPLFGLLVLVFLRILPRRIGESHPPSRSRSAIALGLTLLTALLSEGIQSLGFGDASIGDLVRDMAGAIAFLCLHAGWTGPQAGWIRWVRFTAGGVILGIAALPSLVWSTAYVARNQRFPILLDGGSYLARLFVEYRNADGSSGAPPAGWAKPSSTDILRLALKPGRYSGLVIHEPVADWSAFTQLEVEAFVPDASPLRVTLRIDDRPHRGDFQDRFNESFPLAPGLNRIRIPLSQVREAPRDRFLDLTAITAVHLFASRLDRPRALFIGRFVLR